MDSKFSDSAKSETSLAHQLAKVCLVSPVIVFVFLIFGKPIVPPVMLELLALCLILFGLIAGVFALIGIKRHGKKKILLPSLIGLIANGLLLFIFLTNFFAAREKAIQQNPGFTGSPAGQPMVAISPKTYQGDGFVFQYDDQYQAEKSSSTGQIFLKHPLSSVVITDHRQILDPEGTLKKVTTALESDFSNQNYKDISQSDTQSFPLKGFSAFKAKLAYTRPVDNRVIVDIYVITSQSTTYSFMHYYPEKDTAIAQKLFEAFISSFKETQSPNPNAAVSDKN